MQYVLLFLEGIITFISPCLLPMLPVYVSYFAGGKVEDKRQRTVLINAIGFVAGFTIVFVVLGAFAGSIGRLLIAHSTVVNIVSGSIVMVFGLNYLGVINFRIPSFSGARKPDRPLRFYSAVVFGVVFSVGWTPCVGAFLGAALLRASQRGSMYEGMLMLFVYSMGLGIPFIVCAVLIGKLKKAFAFIQKNYRIINVFAGSFLILVGILMMTGLFGRFMNIFII